MKFKITKFQLLDRKDKRLLTVGCKSKYKIPGKLIKVTIKMLRNKIAKEVQTVLHLTSFMIRF